MERPRDKRQRSPPMPAPYSSRPEQDYQQRSPYLPRSRSPFSIPHGARPRSPLVPRAPHGSRPLSPLRLRSPPNTRPWSPLVPRSRPRSPFVPRSRSPHRTRPRSRSPPSSRPRSPFESRSRGPPPPHGHRPRSPHDPRYEGPRLRSPHPHRSHSPHASRLRSPRSPPRSPFHGSRQHSPLRGRGQSPDSRRRPPYPEAPISEDLSHRIIRRHSGDHRELSPLNLSEKAFSKRSLKITVGNDFFNRHSLERTKLYDALDNVSNDSREDFVDECILPRDFSVASLNSRSDVVQLLSPLNIKNDVDYRRDASCPNSISQGAHPGSHKENTVVPKMSSQHEHFMSSYGLAMEQSSIKNTQDRFNHFSFDVDGFRKDFPRNDATGTGYQNLERPTEQDLYVLLSEGILADKRKRCSELGQRETLLQNQDQSVGKAGCPDGSRMPHNMNMINIPGIQKGFSTIEGKESFLYGNAGNFKDETNPSAQGHIPQKELGGVLETDNDASSPSSELASTQEQSNLEHSEFGKIQDLLKTIGLEIGSAEMGKLSVRTRERLYGKNLPSKGRERYSTEEQMQDDAKLRNRSYTRSPELDQKCSLSPAWSRRTSTDQLSHSKSEFSVREKDGTLELSSSSKGQEPPNPAIAHEPSNLSLNQDPPTTLPGQAFQIAVLGKPSYNYAALPPPTVPPPTLLTPHQMANSAPYTSTHMQQGSINMTSPSATFPPPFPPCPSVPPPLFVPNTNIPPPPFFPPYQVPGFTPYATSHVTQNVGIPTAPPPFGFNMYGNFPPTTKSGLPVSSIVQSTQALPLHSNLKVIQTVDTANSKVATHAKQKNLASSNLVYVHTNDTSDKNKIPIDDKNRVAQKVKVLRDLEKIKSDRIIRGRKLAFLQKKLESLSTRHGEILQNKAQQNYFHTNPLLHQAKRIENELLNLCKEAQQADEQQSSLEKVAKILGLNISEKPNPLAENENNPTDDNLEVGRSTAKSTTPIEVKTQTQVGNSTSS